MQLLLLLFTSPVAQEFPLYCHPFLRTTQPCSAVLDRCVWDGGQDRVVLQAFSLGWIQHPREGSHLAPTVVVKDIRQGLLDSRANGTVPHITS